MNAAGGISPWKGVVDWSELHPSIRQHMIMQQRRGMGEAGVQAGNSLLSLDELVACCLIRDAATRLPPPWEASYTELFLVSALYSEQELLHYSCCVKQAVKGAAKATSCSSASFLQLGPERLAVLQSVWKSSILITFPYRHPHWALCREGRPHTAVALLCTVFSGSSFLHSTSLHNPFWACRRKGELT